MRKLVCIICPRGCRLEVGDNLEVKGNACPKGKKYAVDECTNPTRTVTSVMRISNKCDTMVSVKTSQPIKKCDIIAAMEVIKHTAVPCPIKTGDVLIKDLFGADVIATKDVQ
ncbi:MAG: DUF1667 domain-containing protein [Ruminococcaceae bacterium]|nr:DUF1667 domain-containing protein [Oscillospiraceae bacterium]